MANVDTLYKRRMAFLKEVAAACNAARPSVRNTEDKYDALYYSTTIKDARESQAHAFMQTKGFAKQEVKADGGNGDFSSNVYGDTWTHPSGIRCQITATFYGSAKFNITLSNWVDNVV